MKTNCPLYSQKCGGCPLLQTPYTQQIQQKQAAVQKLLGRFAPVRPIIAAENPWHYRTKAIATFAETPRGGLTCGIYAANSHRVLPAGDCLLQAEVLNKTIAAVLLAAKQCHWPAFNEDTGYGLLRHVLLRCTHDEKQVMVVLVTAQERLPGSRNFTKALLKAAPWVTTIVQNLNDRRTSAVLGHDVRVLYGTGRITETLCGLQFSISASSFFQVNHPQTERLYAKAIELAGLTGRETVVDAYCGTGTIGLCAAAKAARVIGIERSPAAVKDAAANARRNKITNAEFICADATEWMRTAAENALRPQVVLLDPPREGSTEACIAAIAAMQPDRVVYVSCSPETLARDTAVFIKNSYRPKSYHPIDMFPHTGHVECVVLMTKVQK